MSRGLNNLSTLCVHAAKSLQSCPTLCNPMDCSPPGSSVHGILQARILEGCHALLQGDLPNPGIELAYLLSPALAGGFFTTSATWEALARCSQAVSTSLNMDIPRRGRRVLILRNSSQNCEKLEEKEDGCFLMWGGYCNPEG